MNKDKLLQKTDHLHVSAKDVFHSPTHDKLLLVLDILDDKEFVYLDRNKSKKIIKFLMGKLVQYCFNSRKSGEYCVVNPLIGGDTDKFFADFQA